MACHKKKQKNLVPTSSSLMKAAFCSSLLADAHGHLRGKHQSSRIPTATIASLPWQRSLYQLSASVWDCTSNSSRTTSRQVMWHRSCGQCSSTSEEKSYYSGITARSTKVRSLLKSAPRIRVCTSNGSPDMLLNSIQLSKSGMTSNVIQQTAYHSRSKTSELACITTQGGYDVHRTSYVRLFYRPTYPLLHGRSFHYFCEGQ